MYAYTRDTGYGFFVSVGAWVGLRSGTVLRPSCEAVWFWELTCVPFHAVSAIRDPGDPARGASGAAYTRCGYLLTRGTSTYHPASSGADAPTWASRAAPIPAINRHIVTVSSNASGTFHAPVTSRRTPKRKGPPAASR